MQDDRSQPPLLNEKALAAQRRESLGFPLMCFYAVRPPSLLAQVVGASLARYPFPCNGFARCIGFGPVEPRVFVRIQSPAVLHPPSIFCLPSSWSKRREGSVYRHPPRIPPRYNPAVLWNRKQHRVSLSINLFIFRAKSGRDGGNLPLASPIRTAKSRYRAL